MDNSQSSDVFSNSGDYSRDKSGSECTRGGTTTVRIHQMDTVKYKSLVSKTKLLLTRSVQQECHEAEYPEHCTSLIEDCGTCISQSLDIVMNLLAETDSRVTVTCEYMEDAVCLLHMLSSFIRSIMESVSMSCSNMKSFPITTGHIIKVVFTHCKDSETIYGTQLIHVERQLKDLFRNCHELQLMYLMILGEHFVFDHSEKDELDVLIEALEINLKIGEVVQTLDVKTMAEQWKAFTMICEKYSDCLKNKQIYHNCTKILCTMIENNLKIPLELEQDDKVVLRSLKVASFTIKILLKVCNIFRHATRNNHECIVGLLIYIYLHNQAYLESTAEKSPQFINLMNTNIWIPTEALLREVLLDKNFINCVFNLDINIIKDEDKLLGYILLIVSCIKSILQQTGECKQNIIHSIFKILPFGHIWFNMVLKFKSETSAGDYETYGLYEHLLTHTLALAATLDSDEINVLEHKMYEAILNTDCYSAMFSSNLWALLAGLTPRQYLLNQLIYLCNMYQKLELYKFFPRTPQHIHLSYTMGRLFREMHSEDQMALYKQFNIQDDKNTSLWSVLKIKNLLKDAQKDAEDVITEKLKMGFHKLFTKSIKNAEEIERLNKTMKLAATCPLNFDDTLEDCVINAWLKVCSKQNNSVPSRGELDKGSVWFLDYIEALVSLTTSKTDIFNRRSNLVKILHVVSNMVERGNTELKLLLTNFVLKICIQTSIHDEHQHLVESLLVRTFKSLLVESDNVVKNKFFNVTRSYRSNKNIDSIISKALSEENSLQETWNKFKKDERLNIQKLDLKGQLIATIDFKYCHKCINYHNNEVIELSGSSVMVVEKTDSNYFDFADIDTLFDTESDSEPACKKTKLNADERKGNNSVLPVASRLNADEAVIIVNDDVDEIITRLESDTKLLCKVKENVFTSQYRKRIRKLCEKLRNIVE